MNSNGYKNDRRFMRGLVAGLAIGLVLGVAGLGAAAFGKKGWERLGPVFTFKEGYVAGFNDCVRVAKAREPLGLMASAYVLPTAATLYDWVKGVDKVYAVEKYATSPMSHVIMVVGKQLEKEFGPEISTPKLGAFETLRRLDQNRLKRALEEKKANRAGSADEAKDPSTD